MPNKESHVEWIGSLVQVVGPFLLDVQAFLDPPQLQHWFPVQTVCTLPIGGVSHYLHVDSVGIVLVPLLYCSLVFCDPHT